MPSPLQAAGAIAEPSEYAPLTMDRYLTGLFTQRSKLRDADVSYMQAKYYSASRFDSLLDGLNIELTAKLTLARRPGNSVWSTANVEKAISWYSYKNFDTLGNQVVSVMQDTATGVFDVTPGPAQPIPIWGKQAGAGKTRFYGLGNTLYFADGVSQKKLIRPNQWQANTLYALGDYIIDTNGNLEICISGGVSGAVQPVWNNTPGTQQVDLTAKWVNAGTPVYDWTAKAPTIAPVIVPGTLNRFWQPNATPVQSIIDSNGNVQIVLYATGSVGRSGLVAPKWNASLASQTTDGNMVWACCGAPITWTASTVVAYFQCLIDPNGNLQVAYEVGSPDTTGTVQPTWNKVVNGTTTDANVTWVNKGPGTIFTTATIQYAYAYHSIDGSVSTLSPFANVWYGSMGDPTDGYSINLSGPASLDWQVDQIWIYATTQGGAIPLFLAAIPNPGIGQDAPVEWTYTNTALDDALNVSIQALQGVQGSPPSTKATAPTYHNGRIFMIVKNQVIWSMGPDAVFAAANGATAFDPGSVLVFPEALTKLRPVMTSGGTAPGGLIVYGTSNTYIILGSGTPSSPYYSGTYVPTLGLLNYDAEDMVGTTSYLFTNNRKFVSIDPSSGYTEVGFPIGDQFSKVTTGGIDLALYDPANTYVSWCERSSGDSAIYVADGAVGWFRYTPIASPESGYVWSPRAGIGSGTSAVQSVETIPGNYELLIGPHADGGPILARDLTVSTDIVNGVAAAYPMWVTIGNIRLAESGEIAEVAHVSLTSVRNNGNRPQVGFLFDELQETAEVSFDMLEYSSVDPPDKPESHTMFCDRYSTKQNGVCPKCLTVQIMIQWPTQAFPDELLSHCLYGAKWNERIQK